MSIDLVEIAQREKYRKLVGLTFLESKKSSDVSFNFSNEDIVLINKDLSIDKSLTLDSDTASFINGGIVLNGEYNISSVSLFFSNVITNSTNVIVNKLVNSNDCNTTDLLTVTSFNAIVSSKIEGVNTVNCTENINIKTLTTTNDIMCNGKIYADIIKSDSELYVSIPDNEIVNIGNIDSSIVFVGNVVNKNTNQVDILNKNIVLNFQNENDIGNNAGIEIKGDISNGYILTDNLGERFLIKLPDIDEINYIALLDTNYGFYVTGTSTFDGETFASMKGLNVNGNNLTVENNLTMNKNSIITGNTNFHNDVNHSTNITINSDNGNIKNNVEYRDAEIDNILNMGVNSFEGISLVSTMLSANDTFIIETDNITFTSVTSNHNENIIYELLTFSSASIINIDNNFNAGKLNNTIILNDVNVMENIIAIDNINSVNLNTDSFDISNSVIVNQQAHFKNDTFVNDLITTNTPNDPNNNFRFYNKIITSLPSYLSNSEAENNGIPVWGLYRTGGILKIRLGTEKLILNLVGSNPITIANNMTYYEPGVAVENLDHNVPSIFIISIIDDNDVNNNNVLLSPFELVNNINFHAVIGYNRTGTNKSLENGTYTIKYQITNRINNITTDISRSLIVIDNPKIIRFNDVPIEDFNQSIDVNGGIFHSVIDNNLIDGKYNLWYIDNSYYRIQNYNNNWCIVFKIKALDSGKPFTISIGPSKEDLSSYKLIIPNSLANIEFRDNNIYFKDLNNSWNNNPALSMNFFMELINNGVYFKIRKISLNIIINIYDNQKNIVDNITSPNNFVFPLINGENFNNIVPFSIQSEATLEFISEINYHPTLDNIDINSIF
jgi:hypothetical protein